jgi:pSer/pThr/pTyr-binding forkhead associated (FHA) protein
MKLLFPNDEHAPVDLAEGTTLVGSAPDCAIRLAFPGIAARHCELLTESGQSRVRPLTADAATVLNGKQIAGDTAVKPGDLLLFGKIGCRVVAGGRAAAPPAAPDPAVDAEDDMGHTRVRMALPKYLLRGVSGPTFGKVYAMVGTLTVGRSSDADLCIPIEEISRQHAKLQSAASGIVVEDLGSANGTFVNDQRVHTPTLLKAGDEVRFDTVRFLLVSPAQEAQQATAVRSEPAAAPADSSRGLWIAAGLVMLVAAVLIALRYLGKI